MDRNTRKIIFVLLALLSMLTGRVWGDQGPGDHLRIYVVSDAHVGNSDRGEDMAAFARLCNINMPDIVIDLGDTIETGITALYDKDSHREASLSQQRDWLAAWNDILVKNKAVALGNRDVGPVTEGYSYPLSEQEWIEALGYQDRTPRGGSKLQSSFKVTGGGLEALVFVICDDCEGFSKVETLDWIMDEADDFRGDWIIFVSHKPEIYEDIRVSMARNKFRVPALFLHGHNHGPDTLVRDAWGFEREPSDFPSYLVAPLMGTGVAVKFQLYADGNYERFRIDVRNRKISQPAVHYRIFAE